MAKSFLFRRKYINFATITQTTNDFDEILQAYREMYPTQSLKNVYNELKSQGMRVSKDSLYLWLEYACNIFLLRNFDNQKLMCNFVLLSIHNAKNLCRVYQ